MGKNYVELCKGSVRWFYHIKSTNGNILSTSQKYWSKSNAKRAAKGTANYMHYKYMESK